MIYFIHIPKTAGTSLRRLFEATFHTGEIAYIYLPPFGITLPELWSLPRENVQKLKVVYGHFPYGIHEKLGIHGAYATCFRETSERLTSNYLHHLREGITGGLSLLNYVQQTKPKDMDNYAVRLLSGVGHGAEFGRVTRDHFNTAIYNLSVAFDVFGLTEEIETTASSFIRKFHLVDQRVGRENATPQVQAARTLRQEEIDAVMRMNELDNELFAFAKTRFTELYAPSSQKPGPFQSGCITSRRQADFAKFCAGAALREKPIRLDTGEPLSSTKLNLGCGFTHMPGYVNVDLQAFHKPEIMGDIRDLHMLPSSAFEEVYAKAVIEHFEWRDTTRALYEWNRLLVAGGRLFITTTYLTGLLRRLLQPHYNTIELHKLLIINLFSMQKYQGDYHCTAFTERLMRYYLWETGFEIESIEVRDGWLFDVWAKKAIDYSFSDLLASNVHDEQFVITLYRKLLNREADPRGMAQKLQQLSTARDDRSKMIKQFLLCDERAAKMTAACPNFELIFDTA